jgi:hypothetical protein
MSNFDSFKSRLAAMRADAEQYADKDEVLKSLDVVEKAWIEAAKAADLKSCAPVAAALEATQRSADALAFNILFCDTSETSSQALLANIVKFQALERVRGAFEPTMAAAMEESATAEIIAAKLEELQDNKK